MRTEREKFCASLKGPYSRSDREEELRKADFASEIKEEFPASATGARGGRRHVNYERSGVLMEETNMKNGILVKHTIPAEARKPTDDWFVMSFAANGKSEEKTTTLKGRLAYLIGTEDKVIDLSWKEKTMSRQHAVICFRINNRDKNLVSPYLMDLESRNGSRINGDKIEPCRYYEILNGDVVTFGDGEWEHVFIKASPRPVDDKPLLEDGLEIDEIQEPTTRTAVQNPAVRAISKEIAREADSFDTAT